MGGGDITAVEKRQDIAKVYQHYFPNDIMIVDDAHQYLLDHYNEFDFIWSSPPCQKNSRSRFWRHSTLKQQSYPDLRLYQEVIFLDHYFKGKWVVENVNPYYEPLIRPTVELGRHLFWSNFKISKVELESADITEGTRDQWKNIFGFDLQQFKIDSRKDQIYRNCVHPETGLHIFNCMQGIFRSENINQFQLFNALTK